MGIFLAVAVWSAAGNGATWRASGQPVFTGGDRGGGGDDGALRTLNAASVCGGGGLGGAGEEFEAGDLQRRSAVPEAARAGAGAVRGSGSVQPVWADGGGGGCDELALPAPGEIEEGADREGHQQRAVVRAG